MSVVGVILIDIAFNNLDAISGGGIFILEIAAYTAWSTLSSEILEFYKKST